MRYRALVDIGIYANEPTINSFTIYKGDEFEITKIIGDSIYTNLLTNKSTYHTNGLGKLAVVLKPTQVKINLQILQNFCELISK
jgi:hypothetical protein